MSARSELNDRLVTWLGEWTTAPYGVIEGFVTPEGRPGKGRSITFGLARTLDATLTIWSPKRLELKQSRRDGIETFKSEQEFRDYCVQFFGAPCDCMDCSINGEATH